MDMYDEINDLIRNRHLHTGFDDATYFAQWIYDFAVDNHSDPLVLFKVKIYGYYVPKYKWTRQQADWFIENNANDAIGHSDGEHEYLYDWGRGHNKVTEHMMHEPNLDHINPRSLSKDNRPENFRIRCARLNENKGNMVSDRERRATIIDMFMDMGDSERMSLLEHLGRVTRISETMDA